MDCSSSSQLCLVHTEPSPHWGRACGRCGPSHPPSSGGTPTQLSTYSCGHREFQKTTGTRTKLFSGLKAGQRDMSLQRAGASLIFLERIQMLWSVIESLEKLQAPTSPPRAHRPLGSWPRKAGKAHDQAQNGFWSPQPPIPAQHPWPFEWVR